MLVRPAVAEGRRGEPVLAERASLDDEFAGLQHVRRDQRDVYAVRRHLVADSVDITVCINERSVLRLCTRWHLVHQRGDVVRQAGLALHGVEVENTRVEQTTVVDDPRSAAGELQQALGDHRRDLPFRNGLSTCCGN